jgi:hypothetical protein
MSGLFFLRAEPITIHAAAGTRLVVEATFRVFSI